MTKYYRALKSEYEELLSNINSIDKGVLMLKQENKRLKEENKFLKEQNLTLIKQLTNNTDPLPKAELPIDRLMPVGSEDKR